ncbi:hypothetical protein D3C81_1717590 [compost metagenome]
MIVPTTRPRCSGAASVAACGTITCAATALNPLSAVPINNWVRLPALALIARPTAASTNRPTISRRRSSRSPSGTISSRPVA